MHFLAASFNQISLNVWGSYKCSDYFVLVGFILNRKTTWMSIPMKLGVDQWFHHILSINRFAFIHHIRLYATFLDFVLIILLYFSFILYLVILFPLQAAHYPKSQIPDGILHQTNPRILGLQKLSYWFSCVSVIVTFCAYSMLKI
jgi:hypothetical protein